MTFEKIIISKKYNTLEDINEVRMLSTFLQRLGKTVLIDLNATNTQILDTLKKYFLSHQTWDSNSVFEADWVIALGGDGSMLGASRNHGFNGAPITGINLGRVGFLTEINKQDMFEKIQDILDGNFKVEQRHALKVSVFKMDSPFSTVQEDVFHKHLVQENVKQHDCFAINEVVFGRSQKLINCSMFIDNEMVANQYVDGLIVATPTGSTAYSLNAGGSILQPQLPANIIVPICPQNPGNKPMVIDSNSVIHLFHHSRYVDDLDDGSLPWSYDGIMQKPLQSNEYIEIKMAERKISFLHSKQFSYFSNLNKKIFKNH